MKILRILSAVTLFAAILAVPFAVNPQLLADTGTIPCTGQPIGPVSINCDLAQVLCSNNDTPTPCTTTGTQTVAQPGNFAYANVKQGQTVAQDSLIVCNYVYGCKVSSDDDDVCEINLNAKINAQTQLKQPWKAVNCPGE